MHRSLVLALVLTACAALISAVVAPSVRAAGSPAPLLAPPPALAPAPEAAWTVLVYMDGDNDLEKWVAHDIDEELGAVGSNADVQVVVLADRVRGYSTADGDWTGSLAFNVGKGMKATPENAVADWGERDMGSPQTLTDFVTWARASYPSRRTALFFWDHGWGWWPGYTMHDVTSNDTLDMDEIRRAMEAVDGVDMVGMDTCLGQTIEVQATFRGFADALAASEDSIGYTGVEYAEVVAGLQARPRHGRRRSGHGGGGLVPHRARPLDAGEFGGRAGLALGQARATGRSARLEAARRHEEAPA